jgi:hypothetical protein
MANDFNGSEWAGWKTLAMSVSPDPSCTSNGRGSVICAATSTGPVACFAEGYNLYNGRSWTVGNRSAYENISGVVNANAGCPIQSGGELSVRRNRCHGRCLLPPRLQWFFPACVGEGWRHWGRFTILLRHSAQAKLYAGSRDQPTSSPAALDRSVTFFAVLYSIFLKQFRSLVQLRVFHLGSDKNRNVGVGVFPARKKILICDF